MDPDLGEVSSYPRPEECQVQPTWIYGPCVIDDAHVICAISTVESEVLSHIHRYVWSGNCLWWDRVSESLTLLRDGDDDDKKGEENGDEEDHSPHAPQR